MTDEAENVSQDCSRLDKTYEVADLQEAVAVDEKIRGLEVAMKHVRRVDVFEAAKDLVDKVLEVADTKALF